MESRPVEVNEIKSVLERVGFQSEEAEACMGWSHPKLDKPLTNQDRIVGELTSEEQGFLRCIGYAFEVKDKDIDPLRLVALHETFWRVIRGLHDLPFNGDVTVKEGKYIVTV